VTLQELIASGALAWARKAAAVGECTSGVSTASWLCGQRGAQGCELGQQITHAAAGHELGDGLAAAGDHHGLAGLHRIQQAGELGLGLCHRHLPHGR
jgi:hypothetical protein